MQEPAAVTGRYGLVFKFATASAGCSSCELVTGTHHLRQSEENSYLVVIHSLMSSGSMARHVYQLALVNCSGLE